VQRKGEGKTAAAVRVAVNGEPPASGLPPPITTAACGKDERESPPPLHGSPSPARRGRRRTDRRGARPSPAAVTPAGSSSHQEMQRGETGVFRHAVVWWRRRRRRAGGTPAAGARPPRAAARDRTERGEKVSRAGARVQSASGGILSLPIGADSRPISIGRTRAKGSAPGRPRAVLGRAAKASDASYLPRRARRAQNGPWAAKATGQIVLSLLFFSTVTVFVDFIQILSKISYSFFYSIFSNEILIRDCKSYRNFSIKFKVYDFYSCFRCK
jgi:hypothetical protein